MTDRIGVVHRWQRLLAKYGPIAIAVVYLIPRITQAHFGLLDDGMTLTTAPGILKSPFTSLTVQQIHGRFVPGYWLYWAFWYWISGTSPSAFYLANLVTLVASVWLLIAIMGRCGATTLGTWIASLMFIFSFPVAEAYFTLSKGEPLMLLALLGCVWFGLRTATSTQPWLSWIAVFLSAAIAVATREVSVAFAGVAAGWLALAWFRTPLDDDPVSKGTAARFFAVVTAACLPALAGGVWLRRTAPSGSYSAGYQLSLNTLLQSAELRSFELVRDWPAFCLLAIAGVWLVVRGHAHRPLAVLMMLCWAAGSLAILLPWPDLHPYYLLTFGAAASMSSALVLTDLIVLARAGRMWALATAIVAGVLAVAAGVNSFSASRYQIMVDDANSRLVDALQRLPQNSVILVNMNKDHEYLFELRLHLEVLFNRPDLRVEPLTFAPRDARDTGHPYVVVSYTMNHGRYPTVRGVLPDPILHGWESSWTASRAAGSTALSEYRIRRSMLDISTERLWCALVRPFDTPLANYFCPASDPVVDLGSSTYGWRIDAYAQSPTPVSAASFSAGVWSITPALGAAWSARIGEPGDLPVAADWDGDGRLDPGVYRPASHRWIATLSSGDRRTLEFDIGTMRDGDIPVAGDWLGLGHALPGFYRPNEGSWHLFEANGTDAVVPPFVFGNPRSRPLVGDWDGDGRATPGLYQPETAVVTLIDTFRSDAPQTVYTLTAGPPVVVNWSGVGVDTVNVAASGPWTRRIANCACVPSNPLAPFNALLGAGEPFAGRWPNAPEAAAFTRSQSGPRRTAAGASLPRR